MVNKELDTTANAVLACLEVIPNYTISISQVFLIAGKLLSTNRVRGVFERLQKQSTKSALQSNEGNKFGIKEMERFKNCI